MLRRTASRRAPAGGLATRGGQVTARLWVSRPSPEHAGSLTPAERARWSRLRQQGDRDRFATGAMLLRRAVREATGDPTASVQRHCPHCDGTDHGAPQVAGQQGTQYGVSLSHSEERVVVAVTHGATAVGVDVEPVRERLTGVARVLGTVREASVDLAADRPDLALTTRWVRKEAILKAAGTGLRVTLSDLELSDHDEPAYLRHWHPRSCPPQARDGVAVLDLGEADLAGGYVGALAVLTALPVQLLRG